jgi:hypothetical protein
LAHGRLILDRQSAEGWGARVIDRLSIDLRIEFPGMRGLSTRSLVYMRTFAAAYPEGITHRPAAQLPWRHVTTLLDRVPQEHVRDWYAAQDVQHGWSTAVLSHHITTGRHERVGVAEKLPGCAAEPNKMSIGPQVRNEAKWQRSHCIR